jgi:hypothetical protein
MCTHMRSLEIDKVNLNYKHGDQADISQHKISCNICHVLPTSNSILFALESVHYVLQ